MKPKSEKIGLLVTTMHRGVFFGYGVPSDQATITLEKARMCVYWTAALKGVCGLATIGPQPGCRIGPTVTNLILRDVTAVMTVSAEAITNWEKELWT